MTSTATAPNPHPTLSASVQLSLLDPHPLNPRPPSKVQDLHELVASIRSQGLIVPLVVRPLRGDGHGAQLQEVAHRYQVLAGHRRLAALRIVAEDGHTALEDYRVPVLVRPCTDVQALEVVLAENAHHKDVDPFLEGQAVDACLQAHEGDVRAVAAALGVSVRWVAVRRGLKNLSAAWQERLRNIEPFRSWPLYVAELLAALAPDAQDRLFREEHKLLDVAGGPPSRTWWELRVAERTRELGRAPFDVTDANLVAAAGACTTCPFTSTAQPGLFDDGAPEGDPKLARCLNSPCWDRKVSVHTRLALEAARQRHFDGGGLPGLPLAVLPQDEQAAAAPKGCGVVLARHEYVKAREGDKGAVPALEVVGKVDRLVWVKPTPAGSARLEPKARKAAKGAEAAPAAPTLQQQLRQLEDQHEARVEGAALLELLARMRKRAPAASLQHRLAAIFGATPANAVQLEDLVKLDRTGKAPELWPAVVQALDVALAHAPDALWRKAAPLVAKVQGHPWPKLLEAARKVVKPSTELVSLRASLAPKPAPKPGKAKVAPLDRKAHRQAKALTAAPGKAPKGKARGRTLEQHKAHEALAAKLAARKAGRKPANRREPLNPRRGWPMPEGGLKPSHVSDALCMVGRPDGSVADGGPEGSLVTSWTPAEQASAYEWAMREHLAAAGNPVKRKPCPAHVLALGALPPLDGAMRTPEEAAAAQAKPAKGAELRPSGKARRQARPGARPKAKPGTRGNPIDAAAEGHGVLLPKRSSPEGKALEVQLRDGGKGQDAASASSSPPAE